MAIRQGRKAPSTLSKASYLGSTAYTALPSLLSRLAMTDDDIDLHEPEHDHLLDLDDDLDSLLEADSAHFDGLPDDDEPEEFQPGLDDEGEWLED